MFKPCLLLAGLIITAQLVNAQNNKKIPHRLFQLSLAPALGTNGTQPGSYINHFSLNLTSGYSLGNKGIEVGIFSNLNEEITRGFQFAGIANITGGNAFARLNPRQIGRNKLEGFEANLYGGQFAGILNLVETNVFGSQIAGLSNISRGGLFGLQVAGFSNTVKKYSFGVQIAGISNASVQAMDGVQLAGLLNFTKGQLMGAQIGTINIAGEIEGKNSLMNSDMTAWQIGIINKSKKMNGFQIGLINIGAPMQGTQVGLINIYSGGKDVGTKDGTSIGLLNFGDTYNLKVYTDELFLTNYSWISGTLKNARLRQKPFSIYVMNEISFGYNPKLFDNDGNAYSLGYSFNYWIFNRSEVPGMSEYRFLEIGLGAKHLQKANTKLDQINPLATGKLAFGSKMHRKISGLYLFGAITYNYSFERNATVTESFIAKKADAAQWVGYQVGLLVH